MAWIDTLVRCTYFSCHDGKRASAQIHRILQGQGPRGDLGKVLDPRKRPDRPLHNGRHASPGAVYPRRAASRGQAAGGLPEVHAHRRHRGGGRHCPSHLFRDAGQLVSGRLLQEGSHRFQLRVSHLPLVARILPRRAERHRLCGRLGSSRGRGGGRDLEVPRHS